MKHMLVKAVLVGGAAATALVLAAGSASAAGTFTVTAGNAPAGKKVNVKGVTQGTGNQITFTDADTGTVLNCASGSATGSTTTGTGLAGAGIAGINGANAVFTNCTGPFNLQLTVVGTGVWKINAGNGNQASVAATIAGIRARVYSSQDNGATCDFNVRGSVPGRFVNADSTLALPGTSPKLTVSNVSGCLGLIADGDKASYKATYKLTATQASYNPVKITSP